MIQISRCSNETYRLKYKDFLPNEYDLLKTINILFIHEVIKILIYEDNSIKNLYAKLIGLIHYLNTRTVRYDLDQKR